jgi:hypothetical protein
LKGNNLSRARTSCSGHIGTFRKLAFIQSSKKLGVFGRGLLGYAGETMIRKKLLASWVVKGEISFGNSMGLLTQIDDLRSKCCILENAPKNKSTGSH